MATIRKRNDKWQVQVRRKGFEPVTKSFKKRNDAEEWARHIEVQVDRSELPSAGKELLKCTFKELLERYEREVAAHKNSYPYEKYAIKRFTLCKFSHKTLDKVSEADFALYREKRLKEIKPASFNREIAIIRHAFNVARKEWGIPLRKNPLDDFKKPKVKNDRQRRLTTDEYDALQRSVGRTVNTYLWSVVELAIETGMRRGELLNIKKQDIDFNNRTLLIPITKTGYVRTIPLSSRAITILKAVHTSKKEDRLFPVSFNAFKLSWGRLVRRAEITNLHFHDLRHEAISRFFEKGLSVPEVALISGHRSYKMLMRYTHIKPEMVVDKLD